MEIELSQIDEKPTPTGDETDLVNTAFNAMANGHSFNAILKRVEVLSASSPTILAQLVLSDEHMNNAGIMHTGFASAMADILTAAAVRITAAKQSPVVSVDLSISVLQPAQIGDTLLMEANCLQADRSIAFTEAIFRRKSDGQLIVKASQQLAILHYLTGDETKNRKRGPTKNRQNELVTNGVATNCGKKQAIETADNDLDKAKNLMAQNGRATNFNRMAENLRVVKSEPLLFEVETELGPEHLNEGGTMHGGYVASLVDIVSICAVEMATPNYCSMRSMFVSISYLLPAKIGEEIVVKSECLKVGRSIAFTETTISRKNDGAVLAKGKHNISLTRSYGQGTLTKEGRDQLRHSNM